MRFPDTEIGTVGDLIGKLAEKTKPNDTVWFRGHASINWKLTPSLSRSAELLAQELSLMKRFVQLAIPQMFEPVPLSGDEWDWVFIMQHHHMPTRLLDWSESPLAALWFVLSEPELDGEAGAIWCLDPLALNTAAKLRGRWLTELPAFGRDDILNNYLPDNQKDGAGAVPVAAIASRKFRRIAAQQGNFTISHAESEAVEDVGNGDHVWRLVVPAEAKADLRRELAILRFTELQMFPDLDRAAKVALKGVL